MDPIDRHLADLEPLTTDELIEQRVSSLVGRAVNRQVWLLFLHADAVQSPLVMPISDLPATPTADDLDHWAYFITETTEAAGAASVIVVIERFAGTRLNDNDRAWARFVSDGCRQAGVPLRAVALSHRRGVRLVSDGEYRGGG
jgi:hypothetical protein